MSLDALLARLEREAVTSVTSTEKPDVTPKPPPMLACTSVTSVTARNDDTATHVSIALTLGDESAIRRWLANIEETDADLIAHVIERCRTDRDSREYFLRRAGEVPTVEAEVEHVTPGCIRCQHRRVRVNEFTGCVGRLDLPALYGEGHPLRMLPADGGANCASFVAWADRVWH